MKTEHITNYIADDGTKFQDADKCLLYEEQCKQLAVITEPLGEPIDDVDFSNGEGWIQHREGTVIKVMKELLIFIRDVLRIQHRWVHAMLEDPTKMHPSYVGRLIDDNGHQSMYRAWARIMCIDLMTSREYGQPFYAANPKEATGREIKRKKRA